MKISTSTKKAIEKRFGLSFGFLPYSIEFIETIDNRWKVYFCQSKFNECEIAVNINTGEVVRWA